MYHGEVFCPVITEQEAFDDDGNSLGIQPVNPHQIVAARHGLRCSDRTSVAISDRPLAPGIESFYCTSNTSQPFENADADPEVGVIWFEELVEEDVV